jgi:hypothetical protein
VESKVEPAEVIIMTVITKSAVIPKALATASGALSETRRPSR